MPGGSTLPNRLARIKAAIFVVPKADLEQLKISVLDVEAAIDTEYKDALAKKWTRVGAHMKANGVSENYSVSAFIDAFVPVLISAKAAALEKHYKKWQASQKSTAPEAFDSGIEADGEETTT
jgi:L-rhamnose mutarotase